MLWCVRPGDRLAWDQKLGLQLCSCVALGNSLSHSELLFSQLKAVLIVRVFARSETVHVKNTDEFLVNVECF